ncbi:MAG: hypothetical protein RLZ51_126 [Pseudomonadota bacterium]|jgi:hypothetical protein
MARGQFVFTSVQKLDRASEKQKSDAGFNDGTPNGLWKATLVQEEGG